MVLQQVDHVGLQALEGLIDLPGGLLLGAAVDFGHEKYPVAIAVFQSLAHADLTAAIVVIPAVVHEVDAGIDGGADNPDTVFLVLLPANVVATQSDDAYFLAGVPKRTVTHPSLDRLIWPRRWLSHGALAFRF